MFNHLFPPFHLGHSQNIWRTTWISSALAKSTSVNRKRQLYLHPLTIPLIPSNIYLSQVYESTQETEKKATSSLNNWVTHHHHHHPSLFFLYCWYAATHTRLRIFSRKSATALSCLCFCEAWTVYVQKLSSVMKQRSKATYLTFSLSE